MQADLSKIVAIEGDIERSQGEGQLQIPMQPFRKPYSAGMNSHDCGITGNALPDPGSQHSQQVFRFR
jgi:hypothetical protein